MFLTKKQCYFGPENIGVSNNIVKAVVFYLHKSLDWSSDYKCGIYYKYPQLVIYVRTIELGNYS